MSLISNKELLRELINRSADYFNINYLIIEKDYYLFELLRIISKLDMKLIFKGGTSLSMAYRLTQRLSEDLDFTPELNIAKSQRYKLKRELLSSIDSNIFKSNLNNLKIGDNLVLQSYEFSYLSLFQLTSFDNKIKVELYFGYTIADIEQKEIKSLVQVYLEKSGRLDLIDKYNLAAINLSVQKLEVTFVEKIFAICDYFIKQDSYEKSRHLYDLYHLYKVISKQSIAPIVERIRNLRKYEKYPSANQNVDINEILKRIITEDYFKSDYDTITKNLIYDQVTYQETIKTLNLIISKKWF